jgi:Domain of unknown function (DUF4340)
MATPRSTFTLAVLFVLGLGYLLFFEPRLESTDQHRVSERRVLHVHADQIAAIALKRKNGFDAGAVERIDSATWKRTLPVAGAVDSALVNELCSDLEFIDHRVALPGHGTDVQHLYDEGLSPPTLQVTLTLTDHRELVFELGKETPEADGVYLHVADDTQVQVVDKKLNDRFNALLDKLLDTTSAAEGAATPDASKGESHGSD